MCDNFDSCCRICLDEESEHVEILEDPTIQLHIKSCLSINISAGDCFPKRICLTCVSQLREFYNMQLNARCSQDWLESCLQEKTRKDAKPYVQPLPDSEYNSDSLLEFLNSTANIDEYLRNLRKEDIPSIVNMLDKSHETLDAIIPKTSPKKKEPLIKLVNPIKFDVLDSDFEIVKEILIRETEAPKPVKKIETFTCFGCKIKLGSIPKLSTHMTVCDIASRTCWHCRSLFDSKDKLTKHIPTHCLTLPVTCPCSRQFHTKDAYLKHYKSCFFDSLGIKRRYKCKKCSAMFENRLELYRHAKSHLRKSFEKVCDVCSHLFANETELKLHRQKEHNIVGDRTYRCKVCGHQSNNRLETYTHVQQHVQDSPRQQRHLCETCGQSYTSKATLLRHLLTHTLEGKGVSTKTGGPIMCEKCGICFDGSLENVHSCGSK